MKQNHSFSMQAGVIGSNWGRVHVAGLRHAGCQVRALMAGSGEGPDGLPVIEPYKPNSFHRASMRLRETG